MLMSGLKYQAHSVREGRKVGGVTLMYADSFTAKDLPFLNVNNDIFDSVGIELSIKGDMDFCTISIPINLGRLNQIESNLT